jgi:hypothetical protein
VSSWLLESHISVHTQHFQTNSKCPSARVTPVDSTRRVGKQFLFGVFVLLPDDHVVTLMMVTHEEISSSGSKYLKKKEVGKKKEVENKCTLKSLPICVLRMIVEIGTWYLVVAMARTHFLPEVYKELRGVRKLLWDPSA